jgi:hypothetical protein
LPLEIASQGNALPYLKLPPRARTSTALCGFGVLPPSELDIGVHRAAHLFHGLIERKAMHLVVVELG